MLERRGFLRSAALATAGGAIPALPAISAAVLPGGAEPQVEALFLRFTESMRFAHVLSERSWDISESVDRIRPPVSVYVQPEDHYLGLARFGRVRYAPCSALRYIADSDGLFGGNERLEARRRRAAEIVRELDAHEDRQQATRDAVGADEAEEAACEAWQAARAEAQALASAQAATLRGVLLKAKAIATHERDAAEGLRDWRSGTIDTCRDAATALAVSIALDLIRLADFSPAA